MLYIPNKCILFNQKILPMGFEADPNVSGVLNKNKVHLLIVKQNIFVPFPSMNRSRPKSASTCTHGKPLMQVKYKERAGSKSVLSDSRYMSQSFLLPEPQHQPNKHSQKRSQSLILQQNKPQKCAQTPPQKAEKLNRTVITAAPQTPNQKSKSKSNSLQKTVACKIIENNYKHHDVDKCVCEQCTCGRHLCKLHAQPPNLSMYSTYGKEYYKKSAKPPLVVFAHEYDKLQGPHLNMNSSYLKEFDHKVNDDLSRPKPQDLLKTGGPCPGLTSYTAQFPGHKGQNQYVKPTDKHRRQKFPLRGRTTYNTSYLGNPGKGDDWQGVQDCLKTGKGWYGNTSYNNSFKAPNPQNYATIVKKKEKLEINPDYKRQYETTYNNYFLNPPNAVCPAKIALETKKSGEFKNSKIRFMENSDYKAMSPQFRSYSANRCH